MQYFFCPFYLNQVYICSKPNILDGHASYLKIKFAIWTKFSNRCFVHAMTFVKHVYCIRIWDFWSLTLIAIMKLHLLHYLLLYWLNSQHSSN